MNENEVYWFWGIVLNGLIFIGTVVLFVALGVRWLWRKWRQA